MWSQVKLIRFGEASGGKKAFIKSLRENTEVWGAKSEVMYN